MRLYSVSLEGKGLAIIRMKGFGQNFTPLEVTMPQIFFRNLVPKDLTPDRHQASRELLDIAH